MIINKIEYKSLSTAAPNLAVVSDDQIFEILQPYKTSIYCSCDVKAKQSQMFYGDIFYICQKCGKEKKV